MSKNENELLRAIVEYKDKGLEELERAKTQTGVHISMLVSKGDTTFEEITKRNPDVNFALGRQLSLETILNDLQALVLPYVVEAGLRDGHE